MGKVSEGLKEGMSFSFGCLLALGVAAVLGLAGLAALVVYAQGG